MKEINITLKSEIDFSNAKVGDDVFSIYSGIGKIVKIHPNDIYPIYVSFLNSDGEYTETGRILNNRGVYASLYYFNPETQEILYSRPESKIDWVAYEGKMIEVSGDGNTWYKRKLFEYKSEFTKKFLCWADHGESIYLWKQARLIKGDS